MGLGAAERLPSGAAPLICLPPGDGGGNKRGLVQEVRKYPSSLSLLAVLRAKLYSADLESGLHYLLRVELAAHKSLAGTQLKTFKDFMTVVAKVWLVLLRL